MVCRPLPGGGFACGPRAARQRCSSPGCDRWSAKQCDFVVNKPKRKGGPIEPGTCDAHLCDNHATAMGDGIDYCAPHARYVEDHK